MNPTRNILTVRAIVDDLDDQLRKVFEEERINLAQARVMHAELQKATSSMLALVNLLSQQSPPIATIG